MTLSNKRDVLRPVDGEGIALSKRLLREASYGSLASLDEKTGYPLASRVTLANDVDGTPVILISELSSHTPALMQDKRCSLLVGQTGKGDPLSHPRMSVLCKARQLVSNAPEGLRARTRFLARHPGAALYADFGDFHFFKLDVEEGRLNGGFAKAYLLKADDFIYKDKALCNAFFDAEKDVVDHMNEDHQSSIQHYVRLANPALFEKIARDKWRMTGIDPEGIDLKADEYHLRIMFKAGPIHPSQIRGQLVKMAKEIPSHEQ